jgi:hypothetical protein
MLYLKKAAICLTVLFATLSMSGCCFLACGDWGHHDHGGHYEDNNGYGRGHDGGYDHDDRGRRH